MVGNVTANGAANGATDTEPLFATRAPVHIGTAALRVRDLDGIAAFYRDAIGLAVIERRPDGATLGAGGIALLELVGDPGAPLEGDDRAGLFHIAFLLPSRRDLGRWLTHVAAHRIRLTGRADHSVSEAIYLHDPEGNGIEVYVDRPPEAWRWQDGVVTMGNHPLGLDGILAAAAGAEPWQAAPDATRIGHVHLRVGDVAAARRFYETMLGFVATTAPRPDVAFMSSGGYHHHVAVNAWHSAGAGLRDPASTGLVRFALSVRDAAAIVATADRLAAAGLACTPVADGSVETADPWGTRVRLIPA